MRAHKVPATYFSGWKAAGYNASFYVFYKNNPNDKGILKSFGAVKNITAEHSCFMEEDFYYVDFHIKGIAFKLEKEIGEFFDQGLYKIECADDLADVPEGDPLPVVIIDDYQKYISYMTNIDSWVIKDSQSNLVAVEDFKNMLDNYIFDKVGTIIEEDYFANHLESMWGDVRTSIINDVSGLNTGGKVVITRKSELLEFFVVQYLRLDKRIKTDIEPVVKMFEKIFVDMGADEETLSDMKDDGLLATDAYFFGVLLDAARGDKKRINHHISEIDANYVIDVLQAPIGCSYLSSTSPCIFSKMAGTSKEEMLFPLNSQYCLRFRKKKDASTYGQYILQSGDAVKNINNMIISATEDIVVSENEYITNII